MPSTLTIVTPSSSTTLATRAYVKGELGITDSSEDARIDAYIRQASDAIVGAINVDIAKATVAEMFRRTRRSGLCGAGMWPSKDDKLVLARMPVVSVSSVVEDGTTLDSSEYELESADLGLLLRLREGYVSRWSASNIVVTYTAGYDLPNSAPALLQRACALLVSQYKANASRDPTLRSESVDGLGSSSWFDGAGDRGGLSPEVAGILQQFQIPAFG